MIRHRDFLYYYMRSKFQKKAVAAENVRKYFENVKKYAGHTVYSAKDANEYLYELIESGKPFMAGRFGATELSFLKTFDFEIASRYASSLEQMQNWSGFFPKTEDMAKKFCGLMLEYIPEVDILGVWGQPFEDYYIKKYGSKQLKTTYLLDLEPWSFIENAWSSALKQKKVLVIHPFADTIKKQYEKREKIFPGTDILPEFDLKILKAVQTIAGERDERFKDWFEALEWMYEEALNIEFDVAVVGCGAYGFPLAVKLKQAGKQAIHLAGATQLLFGIKGKRWETDPVFGYVQKFFNEDWVYPDETERPRRAFQVEGGCYW